MRSKNLYVRLIVLGTFLILISGFGIYWWNDVISPLDPSSQTISIFVVAEGENVRNIAKRLKNSQLIKDQIAFFLLVRLRGYDNKLQAGDFRLSPQMSLPEIIEEMTHGTLDVWVTTLEGWRIEEIALLLTQKLAIPEQEFLKYAKEGYMFPDTYLLPKDASGEAVARIFLKNFDNRVRVEIANEFKKNNLSFAEGITLASIVEREGNSDSDRPVIAGILLKRLADGWKLQADATVQYALGYQADEKSWWKKEITNFDKEINSSYNTYLNVGLPPEPIANPGLAAIKAVAYPVPTQYAYYLHDKSGKAHYAETNAGHIQNINKYLNSPSLDK